VELFIAIIGLLILFGMLMSNGKGTPHKKEEKDL
jgi:hypothetical protein